MTIALSVILSACAARIAVPNEQTAIDMAKTDYYNQTGERMDKNYPLQALLKDGIWVVTIVLPPRTAGGGPTIEIDQKTGKIIDRYFTQ